MKTIAFSSDVRNIISDTKTRYWIFTKNINSNIFTGFLYPWYDIKILILAYNVWLIPLWDDWIPDDVKLFFKL